MQPRHKLYRKVIKVKATDSPNIRYALAEIAAGKKPSYRELIPGVADYATYLERRENWDEVRQCIGLDAEFYEGAELLLFPPEWMNRAEEFASKIPGTRTRKARGIGIDPAEGGDSTCFAAVDEYGLIELISKKTPNTAVVTGETLAFMQKHGLNPKERRHCELVVFDRGGGGKQHADRLRNEARDPLVNNGNCYPVRTVAFGAAATDEEAKVQPGYTSPQEKTQDTEVRYTYKNKRAEMAGRLSLRFDPSIMETQFAFYHPELRRQLSVIPRSYDSEGRLYLPPKNKPHKTYKGITLTELIGHSPDEMDSVMLAVYAMEVPSHEPVIGAIV